MIMAVVGAITRLTESGLSITEWKPITGAIPPLTQSDWQSEFDLYKQTPEFQKQHFWMGLQDFKKIYFWEWAHRLLGRVIGLAYALPLLFFWVRGWIPAGYKLKLAGVFILGGAQGFMGWYMVQSGLVDRTDVSHFRLAAHLSLAFVIYGAMLWLALSIREKSAQNPDRSLYLHGWAVMVFVAFTIIWGAFTAGLDAGMIYNETFPHMGPTMIPPELWMGHSVWENIIQNPPSIQFVHRWLAIATVLMIIGFWARARSRGITFPALHGLAAMAFIQAGLGIATLFSGVWIPLAALHQAGAMVLLGFMIACLHRLRR